MDDVKSQLLTSDHRWKTAAHKWLGQLTYCSGVHGDSMDSGNLFETLPLHVARLMQA